MFTITVSINLTNPCWIKTNFFKKQLNTDLKLLNGSVGNCHTLDGEAYEDEKGKSFFIKQTEGNLNR